MAKQKVSVTLDEELVAEIKSRYGSRQLSHVVNTFCRQGLEGDLGIGPDTTTVSHGCGAIGIAKKNISEFCDMVGAGFPVDVMVRVERHRLEDWHLLCADFMQDPDMQFTPVDFYESSRDRNEGREQIDMKQAKANHKHKRSKK